MDEWSGSGKQEKLIVFFSIQTISLFFLKNEKRYYNSKLSERMNSSLKNKIFFHDW